jgi:glycosyltransferase involved in cell wall biosynthesis
MEGTAGEFMLRGLELSEGDVICFLDDDDIFLKDKLKIVKNIFHNYPDVDYYRHNFKEVNYKKEAVSRNSVKKLKNDSYIPSSAFKDNLTYLTLSEVFFNSSTICIRRKLVSKNDDFFFKAKLPPDLMLWIIAVAKTNAVLLNKAELSLYRIHEKSVIHSTKGEKKYQCIENSTVAFLSDYKVHDRIRDILLSLIKIREEVGSALFCTYKFSFRHYIMNFMMILLSDNRFKAMLTLLKKTRLMSKPVIVKILENESSLVEQFAKFKKYLKVS